MTAGITEVLTDGGTRKRSEILHSSRVGSRGSHHDGIVHGTLFTQGVHDAGHRRTFLTDGHIDTVHRISGFKVRTLVDDGIDGDGGLTRLTVADNQLTLSATDRNHRIDGLQTRLQRFGYRLTEDNSRRLALQRHFAELAANLTASVQRHAQRVDDTSQHGFAHVDGSDMLGTLYNHPLLNLVGRTQEHGSHIVLLQIHHRSHDTVFKLQQLVGFRITQTVNTCHTIAHLKYGTYFVEFQRVVNPLQLLEQHLGNFAGFYCIFWHSSF